MDRNWDWERLADHIRAEMGRRDWTQRDLADRAKVPLRTLGDLLKGGHTRLPNSVPKVEAALGWEPGSARTILEGGRISAAEPVSLDEQIEQAREFEERAERQAEWAREYRRRLESQRDNRPRNRSA